MSNLIITTNPAHVAPVASIIKKHVSFDGEIAICDKAIKPAEAQAVAVDLWRSGTGSMARAAYIVASTMPKEGEAKEKYLASLKGWLRFEHVNAAVAKAEKEAKEAKAELSGPDKEAVKVMAEGNADSDFASLTRLADVANWRLAHAKEVHPAVSLSTLSQLKRFLELPAKLDSDSAKETAAVHKAIMPLLKAPIAQNAAKNAVKKAKEAFEKAKSPANVETPVPADPIAEKAKVQMGLMENIHRNLLCVIADWDLLADDGVKPAEVLRYTRKVSVDGTMKPLPSILECINKLAASGKLA